MVSRTVQQLLSTVEQFPVYGKVLLKIKNKDFAASWFDVEIFSCDHKLEYFVYRKAGGQRFQLNYDAIDKMVVRRGNK